jgi:hypothetical protein
VCNRPPAQPKACGRFSTNALCAIARQLDQ